MALTDDEQRFMEVLQRHRGHRKRTANELGWNERVVYSWIKRLRDAGKVNADDLLPYRPGAGRVITHVNTSLDAEGNPTGYTVREAVADEPEDFLPMDGRVVKTTTTISKGQIERQWVRTVPEDASAEVNLRMAEIIANLQPAPRISLNDSSALTPLAYLSNLYVLSDAHIGMLAWGVETGADWDLKIAKALLIRAFGAMIAASPKASQAVVSLLGDWMHYDGLLAVTPTSGNILDHDGRHGKMVDIAIEVACAIVEMALAAHESVTLLIAEGNHDLAGTVWLRKMFKKLYADEPRLTVIDHPLPYYAMEFGETFLGFHHGHLKGVRQPAELINVFSHEFGQMWGRTTKRYIHTGDKHFAYEDGSRGTIIRQHPTLAARDAWAARNGYISLRGAVSTTYHERFGETGSNRVCPEMLADSVA